MRMLCLVALVLVPQSWNLVGLFAVEAVAPPESTPLPATLMSPAVYTTSELPAVISMLALPATLIADEPAFAVR